MNGPVNVSRCRAKLFIDSISVDQSHALFVRDMPRDTGYLNIGQWLFARLPLFLHFRLWKSYRSQATHLFVGWLLEYSGFAALFPEEYLRTWDSRSVFSWNMALYCGRLAFAPCATQTVHWYEVGKQWPNNNTSTWSSQIAVVNKNQVNRSYLTPPLAKTI